MKGDICTSEIDYGWFKNFTDCENSKYMAVSVSAAGANVWYLPNVCTR